MRSTSRAIVEEVTAAFQRYEAALNANNVAVLNELFGVAAHPALRHHREALRPRQIAAFPGRAHRRGSARDLRNTVITAFGDDFAAASTEFLRPGGPGPPEQTWVRIAEGWRLSPRMSAG